jgi:hypothetical protein
VRRALAAAALVALLPVLSAAIVAVWAERTLLDPARWEVTSTRLLGAPLVRSDTARYLAVQIVSRPAVAELLAAGANAGLGPLATAGARSARSSLQGAIEPVLASDPVRAAWAQANRQLATGVVAVVDGRPGIAALDGIRIQLAPVLRAAAGGAHLPSALIDLLPPDIGGLTVVAADRIGTVQDAGRALRELAEWFVIAAVALCLVALVLHPGGFPRVLARIGLVAALAGALVLLARAELLAPAARLLSGAPALRRLIAAAAMLATSSLAHIAIGFVVGGLVLTLLGLIAGAGARAPRL